MEINDNELIDMIANSKIEKALIVGLINFAYRKGIEEGMEKAKEKKGKVTA